MEFVANYNAHAHAFLIIQNDAGNPNITKSSHPTRIARSSDFLSKYLLERDVS